MKYLTGACAFLTLLLLASFAFAQANVNESLETNTIYVSATAGKDSNAGTQAAPLQTINMAISKAASANSKGISSKILVEPGTYREVVTIGGFNPKAFTLQAVTAGTAIIDGSNPVTGFTKSGNVYYASWTDNVKGCSLPPNWPTFLPPITLANEMVFVNGVSYAQVLSAGQLHPGTFFVNQSTHPA